MQPTDRQLLLDTHAGRETSARLLWSRHGPRLVAYASSILRRPVSAEDIVQSVFCSILTTDRRRLAEVEDAGAWLTRLTRNAALNALRTFRRERARDLASPSRDRAAPTVEVDSLRRCLARLPRRLREVVVLKHFSGLTFDQMATATGINRATIASRYRLALDRLRSAMDSAPELRRPQPQGVAS